MRPFSSFVAATPFCFHNFQMSLRRAHGRHDWSRIQAGRIISPFIAVGAVGTFAWTLRFTRFSDVSTKTYRAGAALLRVSTSQAVASCHDFVP